MKSLVPSTSGLFTPPSIDETNILTLSRLGVSLNSTYKLILIAAAKEILSQIELQLERENSIIEKSITASNLCVGESHGNVSSIKFLMDNMERFKTDGVNTLYIEHVQEDIHGADLEIFNRTGIMSPSLIAFLQDQNEGHSAVKYNNLYNYLTLYEKAQECGIRLVALDTSLSYSIETGVDRRLAFSYTASEIIKDDQRKTPGRWVALVGSSHITESLGVLGISYILPDCTSIHVKDVHSKDKARITFDKKETVGDEALYADIHVFSLPEDTVLLENIQIQLKERKERSDNEVGYITPPPPKRLKVDNNIDPAAVPISLGISSAQIS